MYAFGIDQTNLYWKQNAGVMDIDGFLFYESLDWALSEQEN